MRLKKITYEMVKEKITEDVELSMQNILQECKGTHITPDIITRKFKNSYNRTNYEFICPYCGEKTTVEANYSAGGIYHTSCCNKSIYFEDPTVGLVYGIHANIDNRDCEIYIAYNLSRTYIVCYDTTNFRKYMWDHEYPCNRDFDQVFGYYSHNNFLYLDGKEDFIAINYNESSHYDKTNCIVKLNSYNNYLFARFEEEIANKKSTNTVEKKPRPCAEFENLKIGEEMASKGIYILGEEQVKEYDISNNPLFIKVCELDELGTDHKFELSCPICKKSQIYSNSDPDVNVELYEAPQHAYRYTNDLKGTVNKKCSCGYDFSGRTVDTLNNAQRDYCYISESEDFITATFWKIYHNEDPVFSHCYIFYKNGTIEEIMETSYNIKEKNKKYLEYYNSVNEEQIDGNFYHIRHENSMPLSPLTNSSNVIVINNAPSLKYSCIDENNCYISNILMCYLAAYLKNNVIEQVYKRFPEYTQKTAQKILGSYSGNFNPGDFSGSKCDTVEDVFGLNKANLKIFAKIRETNHISKDRDNALAFLRILNDNGEIATIEQITYLIDNNISYLHLLQLYKDLPNVKIQEVINYLEYCRQYQCILEPNHSLMLWKDYVHNALAIDVDMSDKKARRPRSLKMEHDIIAYKTMLIQNEIKNADFIKVVRQNDVFAYKNKNFLIRSPKDMEELFEEGRKLNHCVGTYGDKIISGRSNIYFIRKTDAPDIPYITLEVIDNRITQVYGFNDTPPTSKDVELNKFINEWENKTGFFGYRY